MKRLAIIFFLTFVIPFTATAANIGAAGDISNPPQGERNDVRTAQLIEPNGIGLVLPLGDTQYESGEYENFLAAYDLSWGRYLNITRPAVGNHEYLLGDQGTGYYRYFANQSSSHPGYYKFAFQGWDFFVLNTTKGSMTSTEWSAQLAWFKRELAASTTKCQVVYGHHPYMAIILIRAHIPVFPTIPIWRLTGQQWYRMM